jgi:hypothetical protein
MKLLCNSTHPDGDTMSILPTAIRDVRPEPVAIADNFGHPKRFDAHRPLFVVFLMGTTYTWTSTIGRQLVKSATPAQLPAPLWDGLANTSTVKYHVRQNRWLCAFEMEINFEGPGGACIPEFPQIADATSKHSHSFIRSSCDVATSPHTPQPSIKMALMCSGGTT